MRRSSHRYDGVFTIRVKPLCLKTSPLKGRKTRSASLPTGRQGFKNLAGQIIEKL